MATTNGSSGVKSQPSQPTAPVSVTELVSGIKALEAGQTDLKTLDPATRRKTLRPPASALKIASSVLKAAIDRPELKPPTIDPASISARLTRAGELILVRDALRAFLRAVEDTILTDESSAWQDVLAIYRVMQAFAAREPAIALLIAPMAAYLARGPRKGVRAKKAKTSPSAKPAKPVTEPATSPVPPQGAPEPAQVTVTASAPTKVG